MTPSQSRGNRLIIKAHRLANELALTLNHIAAGKTGVTAATAVNCHPGDVEQVRESIRSLTRHPLLEE